MQDPSLIAAQQIHFFSSTLPALIPIVFGFVRFRKPVEKWWRFTERRRLDKGMKLLLFYVLVALLVEISSVVLAYRGTFNTEVFSAFTLFEYILFILIFANWQSRDSVRKSMYASIPLFAILWTILIIVLGPENIDNVILPLNSVIFVALSVQSLFQVNKDSLGTIFSYSEFWFASAVLIYFAGNLMLFSLESKLLEQQQQFIVVWYIHSVLNLTHNLFYARAFACQNRSIP